MPVNGFLRCESRIKAALKNRDEEMGFMPCGQVSGRINDTPTVQELIDGIIAEAEEIWNKITPSIKDDSQPVLHPGHAK